MVLLTFNIRDYDSGKYMGGVLVTRHRLKTIMINTPFPNCIIMTSLKILELFLRHSKHITEFSKNKSLKTQILRKKSCFDQIL